MANAQDGIEFLSELLSTCFFSQCLLSWASLSFLTQLDVPRIKHPALDQKERGKQKGLHHGRCQRSLSQHMDMSNPGKPRPNLRDISFRSP